MKRMIGKIFTKVEETNDELIFSNAEESFRFLHYQDCCEYVYIESIVGDLSDLVGVPILMAEESSNLMESDKCSDVDEWTFYKFATIKGYVDVRWHGSSNGYYSTSVSMEHK
jgi:hypothetical protein